MPIGTIGTGRHGSRYANHAVHELEGPALVEGDQEEGKDVPGRPQGPGEIPGIAGPQPLDLPDQPGKPPPFCGEQGLGHRGEGPPALLQGHDPVQEGRVQAPSPLSPSPGAGPGPEGFGFLLEGPELLQGPQGLGLGRSLTPSPPAGEKGPGQGSQGLGLGLARSPGFGLGRLGGKRGRTRDQEKGNHKENKGRRTPTGPARHGRPPIEAKIFPSSTPPPAFPGRTARLRRPGLSTLLPP